MMIGLGTLSVRDYRNDMHAPMLHEGEFKPAQISTHGPAGSFGAVLFIEKEGFIPLFQQSRLAERFDIAIMSTKGLSNTAARSLVNRICGGRGLPLFVLHDFDKSGFSILGTLQRETRRFSFQNNHIVIDLGLRLADVRDLGLVSEKAFDRGNESSRRQNLRENGASREEVEFLLENRVELNALAYPID
jgi:DNA topoisomerase VI subunit A